ncbi:MAG: PDZ domain-containing protein [Isosphaeraceae bacterium]
MTRDTPAAHSGLKRGDTIIKLGDKPVEGVEPFLQAIAASKPGDELRLEIH